MIAKKENFYLYNKNLKSKANALRKNMTKAEACLWKYVLRGRMMLGFQFRRQRPVLNYIADFMCKELNLIIEVDGITHSYDVVNQNDHKKEMELKSAGFSIIRFTDEDVLCGINHVRDQIENRIKVETSKTPPP